MIPIAGQVFPNSSAELESALRAALSEFFILPSSRPMVTADGGVFPAVQSVKLVLDGATFRLPDSLPNPVSSGPRQSGISIERFDLSARPVIYQQSKFELTIAGTRLAFDFGRDLNQRPVLVLTAADQATAELSIDADDAESLLLAAATPMAKEQGIAIQDLHLQLSSDGPRSLGATVRIKAKKMMMSGVITVTGRVDVSDRMAATFSNLSCTGEGIVGSAAAAFVQKKIQPFEGIEVPLSTFAIGDVTLRDVRVAVGDTIQVTATIG